MQVSSARRTMPAFIARSGPLCTRRPWNVWAPRQRIDTMRATSIFFSPSWARCCTCSSPLSDRPSSPQASTRCAAASGARVFHLGGGVGGREDSLFQYKAGFSDRRHEFTTWQWIVDEITYDRLCRERDGQAGSREVDSAYFPAYRRVVETALQSRTPET